MSNAVISATAKFKLEHFKKSNSWVCYCEMKIFVFKDYAIRDRK